MHSQFEKVGRKVLLFVILSSQIICGMNGIILKENFTKRYKCSLNTLDTSAVFFTVTVRSVLECSSICHYTDGPNCQAFDAFGQNRNMTCRLRNVCLAAGTCPTPDSYSAAVSVYERNNCDSGDHSTIFGTGEQSTIVSTANLLTEETTVASVSTVLPCGGAGTLVSGVCQCELGCSGVLCQNCFRDCIDGFPSESGTKPAYIKPTGSDTPFQVLCNFDAQVTYIQYRIGGNVNFNRSWEEYENGFGNLNGDFWIGNKYIRLLLAQKAYEVAFRQYDGFSWYFPKYYNLTLDTAANFYALRYSYLVVGPNGLSPADSTKEARGQAFSTYDRDPTGCAKTSGSGWWYNTGCSLSDINAPFPVTFGSNTGITKTGIGVF